MSLEGRSLTAEDAEAVMGEIFSGTATPAQIAGYLVALRAKGETVQEIIGSARAMRGAMRTVSAPGPIVVDTCGTGGDRKGTFNISTATAFVVAGAGFCVAKHGNKAVSSACGSADVLQALGVKIDAAPEVMERCLAKVGISFFFAPLYHPAMKHAMGVRRELGIRTIFNILGPLCNPARATVQVLGVFSPDLTEPIAQVLAGLGMSRGFVVHSADGLDEATITADTRVTEMEGKKKPKTFTLRPEDFGFTRVPLARIRGGSAGENAERLRRVLDGEKGPYHEVVVLNASLAIAAAIAEPGSSARPKIAEGRRRAEAAIESGAARAKLEALVTQSNELPR